MKGPPQNQRRRKIKAKAKAKLPLEPAQGELRFESKRHPYWGGAREGAGRKKTPGKRTSVEHRKRERVKSYQPMHVTLRLVRGLQSLRQQNKVYPLWSRRPSSSPPRARASA